MAGAPLVSVVVASHARPLRLRWLLNALEEQTVPAEHWELLVVHDYDPTTAAGVLSAHPLALAGRLRHRSIPAGTGSPARQRNLGWREAVAPLVAFTDDDCRPEPGWLAALMERSAQRPGDIVQGRTRPDPFERAVFAAPYVRTIEVDLVGAPAAVVNQAVEAQTLVGAIRTNWKWRHLAYVVKRHPSLRRDCLLGVFWEPEHVEVLLALAGVAAARRRPVLALLAWPWIRREGAGVEICRSSGWSRP